MAIFTFICGIQNHENIMVGIIEQTFVSQSSNAYFVILIVPFNAICCVADREPCQAIPIFKRNTIYFFFIKTSCQADCFSDRNLNAV